MKQELIVELFQRFEDACYLYNDIECWSARDLQKELGGQAMAYQIVEHSGVDHKELRLRIPALRKAGLIEQRGFANVAAQKSKRVKIWALPNTMSRDSNDASG